MLSYGYVLAQTSKFGGTRDRFGEKHPDSVAQIQLGNSTQGQ